MAKKRSNPTVASCPMPYEQEPHEEQLSEMHSALHTLGDQARKPYDNGGGKLLPKHLRNEKPGMDEARSHIKRLHKAFKAEK